MGLIAHPMQNSMRNMTGTLFSPREDDCRRGLGITFPVMITKIPGCPYTTSAFPEFRFLAGNSND